MQRQWRKFGDKEWLDCDEDWFDECREGALHDTRSIPSRMDDGHSELDQQNT